MDSLEKPKLVRQSRRDSPNTSGSDSSSRSKKLTELGIPERNELVTFVISVPVGHKLPKKLLKHASIRKIDKNLTLDSLISDINDIEKNTAEIINNINQISINCGNCLSLKSCCMADLEANVTPSIEVKTKDVNVGGAS